MQRGWVSVGRDTRILAYPKRKRQVKHCGLQLWAQTRPSRLACDSKSELPRGPRTPVALLKAVAFAVPSHPAIQCMPSHPPDKNTKNKQKNTHPQNNNDHRVGEDDHPTRTKAERN